MNTRATLIRTALICISTAASVLAHAQIHLRAFQPVQPLCRANRATAISAVLENRGDHTATVRLVLDLPPGIHLVRGAAHSAITIRDADESPVEWTVRADAPGSYRLSLRASAEQPENGVNRSLWDTLQITVQFLPAVPIRKLSYIPEPKPAKTDLMVGALACPLWESDRPEMWSNILKHPERTPALGFYGQESPEVADWETKWAVEHGISFFVYCWYRNGQGGPVKQHFGSAIHQALFHSRFRNSIKYAIMWENQARGVAGVSDEQDLMHNLFPFWMQNYFKDPNYQKIDNRPVLYIYRPEFLVQDLGSVENVKAAFGKMRQQCKDAGFSGLYILGEYRGLDPAQFKLDAELRLDGTFPYCLSAPDRATPEQIIKSQIDYDHQAAALGILPKIVTVSQAWSGWNDEGPLWKIPPTGYAELLRQAKRAVVAEPSGSLSSRMLLLDNWNEWGEGHYIAPYREYGFGYLDAVRQVFAPTSPAPADLLPEDIGRGPYDSAFRAAQKRDADLHSLGSRKTLKPGGDEAGLVGWWSFDEPLDSPVAQDDSGHRLGAVIRHLHRAPGIHGNAIVCDGGCALVGNSPLLSPNPTEGITVECWVKTDRSGQHNNWILNRVLSGGVSTGYRLGLLEDHPCFEVPQTDWSHHLTAKSILPLGVWVHLAGTFDGSTMRIYLNGVEEGTMERKGLIKPNDFNLCIGNFTEAHTAHYSGLLDEVKLYNRALTPKEIEAHYRQYAGLTGR